MSLHTLCFYLFHPTDAFRVLSKKIIYIKKDKRTLHVAKKSRYNSTEYCINYTMGWLSGHFTIFSAFQPRIKIYFWHVNIAAEKEKKRHDEQSNVKDIMVKEWNGPGPFCHTVHKWTFSKFTILHIFICIPIFSSIYTGIHCIF